MKKMSIFHILLLLPIFIFGQDEVKDTCSLQTDNIIWKNLFGKTDSKRIKLELISQKIKSDSIYKKYKPKVRDVSAHLYPESFDENGNDCGIKILFVLSYSKKVFIILDLNEHPELSRIVNALSENNVNDIITIFESKSAQSFYGSFGKSGVVLLKTKNKKLIKEIKKL